MRDVLFGQMFDGEIWDVVEASGFAIFLWPEHESGKIKRVWVARCEIFLEI